MNTFILIVVLNIGTYGRNDNSHIIMQEFKTQKQCQYAGELIRKSAKNIASIECIYK